MTVGSRIAFLVDVVHDGNVLAAAKAIGMWQATLSRIVHDVTPNPRVQTLRQIADFYGISVSWLIGEVNDDIPGSVIVEKVSARLHALIDEQASRRHAALDERLTALNAVKTIRRIA